MTINEIAKMAGVSRATVSRYLNDEKVAVTTKPCDAMAIDEVIKRHGINRDNVYMIGLNCGGTVRQHDNHMVCDSCNYLTLTKTICPNPDCKQEYYYLNYDVSEDTISRMREVKRENFFQWDSLYQYKDIVNIKLERGKIQPICPCCHQE